MFAFEQDFLPLSRRKWLRFDLYLPPLDPENSKHSVNIELNTFGRALQNPCASFVFKLESPGTFHWFLQFLFYTLEQNSEFT